VNEDLHQCVIYDSNRSDAKLIGIEYIVSNKIFKNLPEEEKKLWHSHAYEVKSGQLSAPRLPEIMEHSVMKELAPTYGKTFHTWQVDRHDPVPMGPPTLMMAFTEDGQVRPELVRERDQKLSVDTAKNKFNRQDIVVGPLTKGADTWVTGITPVVAIALVDMGE